METSSGPHGSPGEGELAGSPPPKARRRSRTARLGVSLLVVAVSLGALEAGARAVRARGADAPLRTDAPLSALIVRDPALGWRGAPNLRATVVGPSRSLPLFRYEVATNADGFRGRDLPRAAHGEARRIAVLGDSIAWGWGVAEREAFPQVLERDLGRGFEVHDLGVIGYSTDQALRLLASVIEDLAPEVVVLTLLLNDIEGNLVAHNYGLDKPRLVRAGPGAWRWEEVPAGSAAPGWRAWLAKRSSAYTLLRRWRTSEPRVELLPQAEADALRRQEWRVYAPAEVREFVGSLAREDSPTRELVRRMRAVCDRFGARLVLLPIAHHHDQQLYVPELCTAATAAEATSSLSRAVARMAEELGATVCEVDTAMYELVKSGANLDVGDGHPTAAAHAAIAERLAAAMLE